MGGLHGRDGSPLFSLLQIRYRRYVCGGDLILTSPPLGYSADTA